MMRRSLQYGPSKPMYHSEPPSWFWMYIVYLMRRNNGFKFMGGASNICWFREIIQSRWGAVGMVGIWLSIERFTVILSASVICKDCICDVIMLSSGCSSIILYCCDTGGKLEYTLLVVLAWIKVPQPNVPQVTNFILYNVTIFVSDVDIYLCYKYKLWFGFLKFIWNY